LGASEIALAAQLLNALAFWPLVVLFARRGRPRWAIPAVVAAFAVIWWATLQVQKACPPRPEVIVAASPDGKAAAKLTIARDVPGSASAEVALWRRERPGEVLRRSVTLKPSAGLGRPVLEWDADSARARLRQRRDESDPSARVTLLELELGE